MDPNATLASLREMIAEINDGKPAGSATAVRFAELVEALNEWLERGGFLPTDWQASRDAIQIGDYVSFFWNGSPARILEGYVQDRIPFGDNKIRYGVKVGIRVYDVWSDQHHVRKESVPQ